MERGLGRVRDAQEIARQRRYFLDRFSWDQVAQAYLTAAASPAAEPELAGTHKPAFPV